MIFIELHPRLDDPYWVCDRACDYTRVRSSTKIDPGGVLSVVEVLTYDSLAVAVGVEIDRPRWDYTSEVGPQPFEKCSPSLNAMDGE